MDTERYFGEYPPIDRLAVQLEPGQTITLDSGTLRTYKTGATRDTAEGKPVHWRFNSALVEQRFGEYMHTKRIQSDGNLRDGDNWKKGIAIPDYFDSLSRHVNDLKLHFEGYPQQATEPDLETVLCAVLFNVQGLLHEVIKKRVAK